MSSHYSANYPSYPSGYASYPSEAGYTGYAAAPLNSAWQLAKVGAVVGACGAGAQNLRRYQDQEVDPAVAITATLKASLAAGLAAGTAGLVGSQFRSSPTLSLLATLATGTAMMYALNHLTQPQAEKGTETSTEKSAGEQTA